MCQAFCTDRDTVVANADEDTTFLWSLLRTPEQDRVNFVEPNSLPQGMGQRPSAVQQSRNRHVPGNENPASSLRSGCETPSSKSMDKRPVLTFCLQLGSTGNLGPRVRGGLTSSVRRWAGRAQSRWLRAPPHSHFSSPCAARPRVASPAIYRLGTGGGVGGRGPPAFGLPLLPVVGPPTSPPYAP